MTTETLDALAPYNAVRATIAELKAKNAGLVFDYATSKGEKAARSHIYTLRQGKAEIERVRKDAKAEALEYGRKVDAAAKELMADVESMIDVHQKPLDEITQREAARKAAHEANMAALALPVEFIPAANSYAVLIARLEATVVDASWQEYQKPAQTWKDATLATLRQRHAAQQKAEDDAREIARLKAEAATREAADYAKRVEEARKAREDQIAREAEERATKAAADRAIAAARQKEAEAQAAIAAEREKTAQAERAAEQAKREAAEAAAAQARKEQAARAAEAARAANAKHRAKIIAEIAEALGEYGDEAQMAEALASGRIPHVSVKF